MPPPRIIFDTSALIALAETPPSCEQRLWAITSGFDVWLPAMCVDELVAAPDAATRGRQMTCCQRLLASGRCVWPPHIIIESLVSRHAKNPATFDWKKVDVNAGPYERAIVDRDLPSEVCAAQSDEQRNAEEQFMKFWGELRHELDSVFAKHPEKRPTSYTQAIGMAKKGNPNLLLGIGKALYARVAKTGPSEVEIAAFLDTCPPFRAACYGLCGPWYDVALAPRVHKSLAGRNDHMMSVYLPYCGQFITQDKRQLRRLREVAVEANLECEIISDTDFWARIDLLLRR